MKKLKLTELKRLTVSEYQDAQKIPLVIVLDNIRSAMNVGSIFRTADALAVHKIMLCGISATPPNREITKTAIGATESVEWEYHKTTADAISALKSDGYTTYAVEQTNESVDLNDFSLSHMKTAIVLGNEVMGVDDSILPLLDGAIEIAQYGTKHSLNVAVCSGIVLYEIAKQMRST